MIVVADPVPLADQVANHGTGPYPRSESRSLGTRLDRRSQFVPLMLSQAGNSTRRLPRSKPVRSGGFEPLEPSVDGPAGDIQLGAQGDDRLSRDVSGYRFGPSPRRKIARSLGLPIQLAELPKFLGGFPSGADCLTIFRACDDRLPGGRDRRTLILARSLFNQEMDRGRRDPV